MKLTLYTDYAIRVLIYLGLQRDRLAAIHEIAARYRVSENHLKKIVNQLGHAGYVETVRGRGGGVRLLMEPEDINIGAVVRLTEPDFELADCPGCVIGGACNLTPILERATGAFLATLDAYTLADAIGGSRSARAIAARLELPASAGAE